jgi:hypothetical protein
MGVYPHVQVKNWPYGLIGAASSSGSNSDMWVPTQAVDGSGAWQKLQKKCQDLKKSE